MNSSVDLVTLVDQNGNAVGSMDKIEAHRGEGKLHRACSVFLFRHHPTTHQIQLLIQQRSPLKIVGQWQWGNTICGNVRPTEDAIACAHRRLWEELGIATEDIKEVTTFYYQTPCSAEYSEHEFDHIFAGWSTHDDITPHPKEVIAVEWLDWSIAELKTQDQRDHFLSSHDFAPWFRLFVHSDVVRTALENFLRK